VLNFRHKLKIFFPVVQSVMILMVNDHIVWAMSDLSVHPDHKLFSVVVFCPVGITVIKCFSGVPNVWCDPAGVIIINDNRSVSAFDDRAIKKLFGIGVDFNEHFRLLFSIEIHRKQVRFLLLKCSSDIGCKDKRFFRKFSVKIDFPS